MQKNTGEAKLNVARRASEQVMKLSRLGCFHQSRLSFMRVLTRRLKQDHWRFEQPDFNISDAGVGYAVYSAIGPERSYSLIAFAHDLPDELRSDRVIAEQWDATFVLFDGVPTAADITRLKENVPHQEAGRVTQSELSLSRANRSVRLWEYVVNCLSDGRQPAQSEIDSVGYLMRTTAVYGSGKFGAADRESLANRVECNSPFQVEMLTVYLIRVFVRDLVSHMAAIKGGDKAVCLDKNIARSLGIGNSTGLGMAPFILNHAALFNNWIIAREQALAEVRSVDTATADRVALFKSVFKKSCLSIDQWGTSHTQQQQRVSELQGELIQFARYIDDFDFSVHRPWDKLYRWAEMHLNVEAQELLVSLLLEPYGDLVDGFAHCMGSDEPSVGRINGTVQASELIKQTRMLYRWALDIDWSTESANARAWYVSEEKLEPRLGERFDEPVAKFEQPLSPARDAIRLLDALQKVSANTSIAEFLLHQPEYRHTVRRIQTLNKLPYGEIHDNTIDAALVPVDMLRCKLSFFGAIHFDPRSDRWVRIRMFANAPYPEELSEQDADFWAYP